MPVELDPNDIISRCIIYSRHFQSNIHVNSVLWPFGETKQDGASHESGVLRRLAEHDDDVHRVGCGIAAAYNERKNQPAPGPKRRYYCGFRSALSKDIPRLGDGYELIIKNEPENGEDSHLDFALKITAQVTGNARATLKTDAGIAIAESFGAATSHTCDCDTMDAEHPIAKFGEQCLQIESKSASRID